MVGGRIATTVGDDVTVGHRAILHGCTIGNRVLVGMGAIVLDGAEIADDCLIGAGSLVTPGMKIEEGRLVLGNPARVVRCAHRRGALAARAVRGRLRRVRGRVPRRRDQLGGLRPLRYTARRSARCNATTHSAA